MSNECETCLVNPRKSASLDFNKGDTTIYFGNYLFNAHMVGACM